MAADATAKEESRRNPHGRQMVASLLVALLIVVVTIALVTARLGANGGVDSEGGGRKRGEDNSGKGSDNSGRGSGGDGRSEVRLAAGRVTVPLVFGVDHDRRTGKLAREESV